MNHCYKPQRKYKHQLRSALLCGFLLFLSLTIFIHSKNTVLAQEAGPDSVSEEEIKENLKERLEKVVKNQEPELLKRAWVGTLDSIANHTLTIETKNGPKLASISAETTFLLLPKKTKLEVDDLEIGAQTIAMGYVNGNQVLDARRIIIDQEPSKPSDRQVLFVIIDSYDAITNKIAVHQSSGEILELEITKQTQLTESINDNVQPASTDSIENNVKAIIIIKTFESQKKMETTLLKLHFFYPTETIPDEKPETPVELNSDK